MKVADLMTKNVACIGTEDKLGSAAQLLWEHDCGALPVRRADGKVVGMITDRDICMAAWSRGLAPDAITVADAMSTQLVGCSAHDSITDVESRMRSNQLRRLPVLDEGGQLVGIISLADLARQAGNNGVEGTLAGICMPAASPAALGARA
jgi:CBS domain-containing protein